MHGPSGHSGGYPSSAASSSNGSDTAGGTDLVVPFGSGSETRRDTMTATLFDALHGVGPVLRSAPHGTERTMRTAASDANGFTGVSVFSALTNVVNCCSAMMILQQLQMQAAIDHAIAVCAIQRAAGQHLDIAYSRSDQLAYVYFTSGSTGTPSSGDFSAGTEIVDYPGLGIADNAAHGRLPSSKVLEGSVTVHRAIPRWSTLGSHGTRDGGVPQSTLFFDPCKAAWLRTAAAADLAAKSEANTMPPVIDPSLNRHKLRIALRRARGEAGISQQETTQHLQWSLSKLIRIESGAVSVSVTDLRALMDLYGISMPETMRDLEEAARNSRGTSWWSHFSDVTGPAFHAYLGYESPAAASPPTDHLVAGLGSFHTAAWRALDAHEVPRGLRHGGAEPRTVWHKRDFTQDNGTISADVILSGTTLRHTLAESAIVGPQPKKLTLARRRHGAVLTADTECSSFLIELGSACATPCQSPRVASFRPQAPAALFLLSSRPYVGGVAGPGMPFARAVGSTGLGRRKIELPKRTKDVDQAFFFCDRTARPGRGSNRLTDAGSKGHQCISSVGMRRPSMARRQRFLHGSGHEVDGLQYRSAQPAVSGVRAPADCRLQLVLRDIARTRPVLN